MKEDPQFGLAAVRMMGHFAAMLVTVLDREGIIAAEDFAQLLSTYASITTEADEEAGAGLMIVAAMLGETAAALTAPFGTETPDVPAP